MAIFQDIMVQGTDRATHPSDVVEHFILLTVNIHINQDRNER